MKKFPNIFYCVALVFVGTFYIEDAEYTSADSINQISSQQEYNKVSDVIQTQHAKVVWFRSIDQVIFIANSNSPTWLVPLIRSDKEVPIGIRKQDL